MCRMVSELALIKTGMSSQITSNNSQTSSKMQNTQSMLCLKGELFEMNKYFPLENERWRTVYLYHKF